VVLRRPGPCVLLSVLAPAAMLMAPHRLDCQQSHSRGVPGTPPATPPARGVCPSVLPCQATLARSGARANTLRLAAGLASYCTAQHSSTCAVRAAALGCLSAAESAPCAACAAGLGVSTEQASEVRGARQDCWALGQLQPARQTCARESTACSAVAACHWQCQARHHYQATSMIPGTQPRPTIGTCLGTRHAGAEQCAVRHMDVDSTPAAQMLCWRRTCSRPRSGCSSARPAPCTFPGEVVVLKNTSFGLLPRGARGRGGALRRARRGCAWQAGCPWA
jgi:hypothetical protein